MSPEDFRRFAVGLPEAVEQGHAGHPDFRVGGKIFATLGYPDDVSGTVMLSPEGQMNFMRLDPAAFKPAAGAWGRRGGTCVRLDVVSDAVVQEAVVAAWQKRAPEHLWPLAPGRRLT